MFPNSRLCLGQILAHQLFGSPGQHVGPVQESSPLRQPEARLNVRGIGKEILPPDGSA